MFATNRRLRAGLRASERQVKVLEIAIVVVVIISLSGVSFFIALAVKKKAEEKITFRAANFSSTQPK